MIVRIVGENQCNGNVETISDDILLKEAIENALQTECEGMKGDGVTFE